VVIVLDSAERIDPEIFLSQTSTYGDSVPESP
jgi:hypothetical protein